jgi:hypothetical protein
VKKTFLDAAIRKCGGKEEKGRTLYAAYGSNGQVLLMLFSYILIAINQYKWIKPKRRTGKNHRRTNSW